MGNRSARGVHDRQSESQRERAYQALRRRLITLELPPGAALDLQGLMRELSLGRTPLNEAIQQLARENLLTIHPRQGTIVTQPSFSQLRHIVEVRDGYEGRLARFAARRRSTADIAEIRALDERLRQPSGRDAGLLVLDDRQLHLRIAQAAGNPFLEQAFDQLSALYVRLWRLVTRTGGSLDPRFFSHARLIDAIISGDPDAAEAAAVAHVEETNAILLASFGGEDVDLPLAGRELPAPLGYPLPVESTNRRPTAVTRRAVMRAATFAAGLSGLTYASGIGSAEAAPAHGGRIETALFGEPDTLDPHRTKYAASAAVFSGVFDRLVAKTAELHYEGVLAESWEISEDGLEYTFRLRQGIAFHDGSPFDADSVAFTFRRILSVSAWSFLLEPVERVEIIDRHTVKLVLNEPLSPLLDTLSAPFLGMLPPKAASQGEQFGRKPIGTGPWVVKEWVAGDRISLERNSHYQNFHSAAVNRGAPLLDELVFRFVPSIDQLAAFESGDINVITIPPEQIERFQADPSVQLHTTDGGTVVCYLDFAMLPPTRESRARFRPPFDDHRVRRAFGIGFNADEIVPRTMRGLGVRNPGPLPTATFAYRPEIAQYGFHFDPAEASALLTAAGWVDEDGDGVRKRAGVPLDLLLATFQDRTMVQLAEAIRDDMARLGVRIRVESYDGRTYLANGPQGVADLHLDSYGWTDPDLLYLMTNGDFGIGLYRDEEYQELVLKARRITDLNARADLYFEAAQKLLADAAMVPIATYIGTVATREEVKGFKLGPQGIFVLDDAYVMP